MHENNFFGRVIGRSCIIALVLVLSVAAIPWANPMAAAQTVMCKGNPATIIGTDQDDLIQGTAGDDVIVGLGGNDTINALDGDDVVCGSDGDDEIDGGPGLDFLLGGLGDDHLYGFEGNDRVIGGRGADTIYGGNGNDILKGNAGNDYINGGRSHDVIGGGAGNDHIEDNQFQEELHDRPLSPAYAHYGHNQVKGGKGNDRISVHHGNNVVNGGQGNDTISSLSGPNRAKGQRAFKAILKGDLGNDRITGGGGDDELRGGRGNDTIISGGGFNEIHLLYGQDSLISVSRDTIIVGPGDHEIEVERTGSSDTLIIPLNDKPTIGFKALLGRKTTVVGGNGPDEIIVDTSAQAFVNTRGGDDVIIAREHARVDLFGGDGADRITAVSENSACAGGTYWNDILSSIITIGSPGPGDTVVCDYVIPPGEYPYNSTDIQPAQTTVDDHRWHHPSARQDGAFTE